MHAPVRLVHDVGVVMARRGRSESGSIQPFLVECLYETQDEALCQEVLGEEEVRFWGVVNCTLFGFFAVGYCVSASKVLPSHHLSCQLFNLEIGDRRVQGNFNLSEDLSCCC